MQKHSCSQVLYFTVLEIPIVYLKKISMMAKLP